MKLTPGAEQLGIAVKRFCGTQWLPLAEVQLQLGYAKNPIAADNPDSRFISSGYRAGPSACTFVCRGCWFSFGAQYADLGRSAACECRHAAFQCANLSLYIDGRFPPTDRGV
jgi:hypothetical protein